MFRQITEVCSKWTNSQDSKCFLYYRSFASTGPKHEWNPMPCKLVIYCWHATLHFRCRATQVLELKSVHPDDLQPGWGEDENLGSEIELGWKVCRESPNNWLPKSCLTSSFCWSTLVRCKACNNWYISGDSIKNQYKSLHNALLGALKSPTHGDTPWWLEARLQQVNSNEEWVCLNCCCPVISKWSLSDYTWPLLCHYWQLSTALSPL